MAGGWYPDFRVDTQAFVTLLVADLRGALRR